MHQAFVTIILGIIGTWIAQWLAGVNAKVEQTIKAATDNGENPDTWDIFMAWATNFSNGDVLAIVEILLICYVYARVRDIERAMPVTPLTAKPVVQRIFGF